MTMPKQLSQTLTRKQKAFADTLLRDPKKSATKAASETYNATTPGSAGVIAAENLKKPNVMAYLESHASKAELALIDALQADTHDRRPDHHVRIRAADSILDRVHGKATQKHEHHGVFVNLNMDLTGDDEEQEGDG